MEKTLQLFQEKYPHLFQKLIVGGKTLKNRIVAAPTHHGITTDHQDLLNERGVLVYGDRARGGAAVVTIGEGKIDALNSTAHEGHVDCYSEKALQGLHWYSTYVHAYGALASIEFNHSGQFASPQFNAGHLGPMGASECIMPNGILSREMTEEDMEVVAENIAKACLLAKRGGLDMAMLHYGHGWLFGGFLSPMFNHRTDKYGGSLENRVRFPRMVLQRVRQAVGKDFLLELRLSGDEMTPNGLKIQDTVEIVKMLEEFADMVHVSSGTRLEPLTRGYIGADHFTEPGHNAPLSEAIKKAGVKIPVGVVGNINSPAVAERILAQGQADYVVMARNFIADFDWAEKVRAGREEDIRPCIKCCRCGDLSLGKDATGESTCSVNPLFGHGAMRKSFPPATCRKKIVVVGGGVAGMQAAVEASARGHEVILYEKEWKLGGQLFYADYVWFKREMKAFREYLIRQVKKAPIVVKLGLEATPEQVYAEGADAVIVAVGAEPFIPPITGVNGKNVKTALEVFGHEDCLGDSIVIIGGGMVGCELSLHLSKHGKQITILEMGEELAPDAIFTERVRTLDFMRRDPQIQIVAGLCCTAISEMGVEAVDRAGNTKAFAADTVVLASGMRSRTQVRDSFEGSAYDVIAVGDCKKVGTVFGAVSTGFDAALIL